VIECGQNAKEKSNNWKTLLIARLNLESPWVKFLERVAIDQPLGQVHVHGAFWGPCIAGLVLQDIKFGHWEKAIISFKAKLASHFSSISPC
jgi:hypothetical protein